MPIWSSEFANDVKLLLHGSVLGLSAFTRSARRLRASPVYTAMNHRCKQLLLILRVAVVSERLLAFCVVFGRFFPSKFGGNAMKSSRFRHLSSF